MSSHIETSNSPTVAYEKRKKRHYRKIVLAVPLNPDFYSRIVATSNRIDVPQLEKKSHGFVSNNELFDQEFKIYSSNQSSVVHFFQKYEIETSIHYPIPVHKQKALAGRFLQPQSLHTTEDLAQRIVSLPIFPGMATWQISKVAEVISKCP
jgi:dTDP-4-amino-4,6-dideoxygalactose transaminase